MINEGESRAIILTKLPDQKWYILNNSVYLLNNFFHPGGNFIMAMAKGKEIGRFFFGAYGIETTTIEPHLHSQNAYGLL
jgi:cytochrome b involved in lipid metabolism